MRRFQQQLSRWAGDDLAGIADYTLATWGERQLEKYRALLEEGLAVLARDPFTRRSKERDEILPGCRSIHGGRHIFLYRVRARAVQIARVLHDSMELERQHIPAELLADWME